MDREKLYERLDDDPELSDEERRDIYRSEIEDREAEEQWQEEHS